MLTLFRTLEFLGLSVWLGSDVFLSFVVAPGAFRVLAPNRDQAGAVVGFALTGAIIVTRHGCANFMPTWGEVEAFVAERGGRL